MLTGTTTAYQKFNTILKTAAEYSEEYFSILNNGKLGENDTGWLLNLKIKIEAAVIEALKLISIIPQGEMTGDDLCRAVQIGNIDLLKMMFTKKLDPNMLNLAGNPPLFYVHDRAAV